MANIVEELEKRTIESRVKWNNKILSLIKSIADIKGVPNAQIFMLSYRHQLVDKIADLRLNVFKINSLYDTTYKEKYIEYKSSYNLKLNAGETDKFVKSDLSNIKRQYEVLNSHIDFYSEVIKTLDNLGWAIKRRMDLYTDEML